MSAGGAGDKKVRLRRVALVAAGLVCVALGALGLILPLLPTTPFLLLAGYLFARSSGRWHRWLMSHRLLGPYIHAFRGNTGLTSSQKVRIAASFTILLGVSFYVVPGLAIKIALAVWWVFWIVYICRLKTVANPVVVEQQADPRG